MKIKCKICNSNSDKIFHTVILNKYDVEYFKCPLCHFIQTEEPYWLPEAYSSAITSLDIGLVRRNLINYPIVKALINSLLNPSGKFIDYGGGYGMFVRIMRDEGFDYYRQDIYCENLFCKNFDITDIAHQNSKFELLTAFEVFEHLTDPMAEFDKMSNLSDNIFFSTDLHDKKTDFNKWWYLIPETGQHIALYSRETLQYMANSRGMYYYSQNNFHLITKTKIPKIKLEFAFNSRFQRLINRFNKRKSLLEPDFNSISSRSQN